MIASMGKKVPILYFSGSGSTKMVAEVVAETLSGSEIEPVMMEVTQKLSADDVAPYDFFVVLTPTYNARPSQLLLDFIDGLPLARYEKAAYVIATYGLYPINCQRIVGQRLLTGEFGRLDMVGFAVPHLTVLYYSQVGFPSCSTTKSMLPEKYVPWLKK